jgi:arylsulfatase A-like enzyme
MENLMKKKSYLKFLGGLGILGILLLTLFFSPRLSSSPPSLIVITLDTTRADRLGCYGYPQAQTPHLDRFAQENILFENTLSPAPMTLPAHASLFTGMYPLAHGIRSNVGFQLPKEILTLAEFLQEKEYQTGAFIASHVLSSSFGLNQGFEDYEQIFSLKKGERRAEEVRNLAQKWLEERTSSPFFLWLHFFDPHAPYNPPAPFNQHPPHPYDGELAYLDQQLGLFFQFLQDKKLYDSSLLFIVGDHGESLGEHGEETHSYFAYDSVLKVPFLLKLPKPSSPIPLKISEQVRLIDILPTILSFLEIPTPSSVQGRDLSPLIKGQKVQENPESYSENYNPFYQYGCAPLRVLRNAQYKYIESLRPELYHLLSDPQETRNILENEPEIAKQMQERLKSLIENYSVERTNASYEADPRTLEALGTLGYGGALPHSLTEGQRREVKEELSFHQKMVKLQALLYLQHWKPAQSLLNELREIRPDLPLLEDFQIKIWKESQNYSRFFEYLEHQKKDLPILLLEKAKWAQVQSRKKEACAFLEELIRLDPTSETAYALLWEIRTQEERYSEIWPQIQKHLQENPQSASTWFWQGELATLWKKDQALALNSYEKSLTLTLLVLSYSFCLTTLTALSRSRPRRFSPKGLSYRFTL